MLLNNCELNIIVKGRKVDEFQSPMDFQRYIEGRDGSEFELELVNRNPYDCEFIVSVDGLSVTDGKLAGKKSGGYVVPANTTHRIPGWLVDGDTAAKFTFAGAKGGSYVEQAEEGDERNKGVIAAMVFERRGWRNNNAYRPRGHGLGNLRSSFSSNVMGSRTKSKGMSSSRGTGGASAGGDWSGSGSLVGSNVVGSNDMNLMNCAVASASAAPSYASPGVTSTEVDASMSVEQTLGTGFGEATKFETTSVQFERGDMVAKIVVHYDDRQGLKRRGIDVNRRVTAPNPFPADEPTGCTPPAGWGR
jgi:hypothetical protein